MADKWWKAAIGYQIWPASFRDSNHDGFGDIPGITSKLDYLVDLGIDLIWLSPVYDSPQHDMGYDVANYESIYHKYGTLEDMDDLIKEAKKRNIKVLMDLVINHTSNEHAWFLESKKSRDNKYSDWYIWRDARYHEDGSRRPPSNWRNESQFGGSTWEYVPERDQYYFHLSAIEQPDLNWYSPEMRQAIYDSAVDFWLRRGIDGFRVDVVGFYWKDPKFPDVAIVNPNEELQPLDLKLCHNGPLVHTWLKEIRGKIQATYGNDVVLIGELPMTSKEECVKYVSPDSKELDISLEMDVFMVGNTAASFLQERKRTALPLIKDCIHKSQSLLDEGGWTTAFLESHDFGRSVSRFGPGDGPSREAAAKMMALLVGTLSGTLFVYQGQEIGMTNFPAHWDQHDLRDPADVRHLREFEAAGDLESLKSWLDSARLWGRDNARTPVQWSPDEYAGFSKVPPWIRVNDNYTAINCAEQKDNPDSVLAFWKRIIRTRKKYSELLIHGRFDLLDRQNEQSFSFTKTSRADGKQMLAVCNFSDEEVELPIPADMQRWNLSLKLSTLPVEADTARLRPWEGRLFSVFR
jgi:alpha-glucosidase